MTAKAKVFTLKGGDKARVTSESTTGSVQGVLLDPFTGGDTTSSVLVYASRREYGRRRPTWWGARVAAFAGRVTGLGVTTQVMGLGNKSGGGVRESTTHGYEDCYSMGLVDATIRTAVDGAGPLSRVRLVLPTGQAGPQAVLARKWAAQRGFEPALGVKPPVKHTVFEAPRQRLYAAMAVALPGLVESAVQVPPRAQLTDAP